MRKLIYLLAIGVALLAGQAAYGQDVVRIAAVVNDEVISIHDLIKRMRLVVVMSRLEDTPDVRNRIASQVLRTLIDEKLQEQEAERLNLGVSESELEDAIGELERANGFPSGQFHEAMRSLGIAPEAVIQQLRASLAWGKVIGQRIRPTVRVTDEEVQDVLERLRLTAAREPQFLLGEIFLGVDNPEQEEEVRQLADQLVREIADGANFAALANQFSESASAEGGGDLGWLQASRLSPELQQVVPRMQPGEVSPPIRTLSGFHIIALRDRRVLEGGNPRDVTVSLAQVKLASDDRDDAEEISQNAASCEDMEEMGNDAGADTATTIRDVAVTDLNRALQEPAMALEIGKPSGPIVVDDGVMVVMVCGRTGGVDLPDPETVREQIGRQRIDLATRRYMRDLRRAAFLDVRV